MIASFETRIILNGILLFSLLFLPWWFFVLTAGLLLILFSAMEVLLWGVLFDILYASPIPFYFNIPILFTLVFTTAFFAFRIVRRRLVFY